MLSGLNWSTTPSDNMCYLMGSSCCSSSHPSSTSRAPQMCRCPRGVGVGVVDTGLLCCSTDGVRKGWRDTFAFARTPTPTRGRGQNMHTFHVFPKWARVCVSFLAALNATLVRFLKTRPLIFNGFLSYKWDKRFPELRAEKLIEAWFAWFCGSSWVN